MPTPKIQFITSSNQLPILRFAIQTSGFFTRDSKQDGNDLCLLFVCTLAGNTPLDGMDNQHHVTPSNSTETQTVHWQIKGNNSKGQDLSEQAFCVSSGHEFTHVSCHPNSLRFSKTRTIRCDKDNMLHFSNTHFNIITDIYAQICQVHNFLRNLRPKLCTQFISPLRVLHDLPIEMQGSE